jgi:hypothetical protein
MSEGMYVGRNHSRSSGYHGTRCQLVFGVLRHLGFAEVFRDVEEAPRYVVVRRGPVKLHLEWTDPGQWAHAGNQPAYQFLTPTVDALHAEALTAGALSQQTGGSYAVPNDTPWVTREFHVLDPAANVLQLYGPLADARAVVG